MRFVSKNMTLSSDHDVSGLTQSTFRANDEFGQSEYDVLRDIFQTVSPLDISVEEQSVLSKNTSECYHKVITWKLKREEKQEI